MKDIQSADTLALIQQQLLASAEVKEVLANTYAERIAWAAGMMVNCFQAEGRVFFCGNGGSAADCQHLAAELVSKLNLRRNALPALALTTDTSLITAISNDDDFSDIFLRQVQALAIENDLLIAISTSGNSLNVCKAVTDCRRRRIQTIALTGKNGGKLAEKADLVLKVPSDNVQRIQECHIAIGHILCDLVEKTLFGNR